MPKYRVSVEEVILHVVDVEAGTEQEAGQIAIDAVIEDDRSHFMEVSDRGVKMCLEQP
ncbi:hypothetical protein [Caballeronia sp. LZ034LL]|uniref:hypothetical protein n=1 Tax=Caballeronia sp. LZ034LL TaxID=3038567 RepID=UPI0028580E24|nr:hypothetical protein [Caballeronia sp. LZ034LL]MDR5839376.1 hypothetical protein [Caballeronia sp. LZ034LL]